MITNRDQRLRSLPACACGPDCDQCVVYDVGRLAYLVDPSPSCQRACGQGGSTHWHCDDADHPDHRGALGQPMWGTWWAWDPRLTSFLILFLFYLGYVALWAAIDNPDTAADLTSVLCMVGSVLQCLADMRCCSGTKDCIRGHHYHSQGKECGRCVLPTLVNVDHGICVAVCGPCLDRHTHRNPHPSRQRLLARERG